MMNTPTVGDDNDATGIGADVATSSRSSKRTRNVVVIAVLVAVLGGGAALAGVMASGDRAGYSGDSIDKSECEKLESDDEKDDCEDRLIEEHFEARRKCEALESEKKRDACFQKLYPDSGD
jgi:hypothetical protein